MSSTAPNAPIPGTRLVKVGPVLSTGSPGTWDDGMVESPMVWFDDRRGRYAMVYTGYQRDSPTWAGYSSVTHPQIGLAWSDDLLVWEKDDANPIHSPSSRPGATDSNGCAGPFVFRERRHYYLFYFGTTADGYEKGVKAMHVAISDNLYQWRRHPGNPVVEPAGSGWRAEAIWHPHVVRSGDQYLLFFNASGTVDGHHEERIGYATSADLLTWNVDDANSPILAGSAREGAWDSTGRAGDPSLFRHGDTWVMAYYSWDGTSSNDGIAVTSSQEFPLGWVPIAANPVLRTGLAGSFDSLHAGKPFIYREHDRHFHYYTAVDDDEHRVIGLAVWPPGSAGAATHGRQ